ncbi:hypothetical protein LTR93_005393 [Exophiala xenobiotica]|nr:hypothetical protein LTR93_005393 [Exophiala xenobiotica]
MATDVATQLVEILGTYPVSKTFAATDNVPDLQETEVPAYSAAFDVDPTAKRHTACDECRKRKLKCSGDPTGCGRCLKQTLTCHYSMQSKMGRPRKRQKMDDSPEDKSQPTAPKQKQSLSCGQPGLEPHHKQCQKAIERTEFENVCNAPISQSIRRSAATASNTSHAYSQGSSSTTPPLDATRTPPDGDMMASTGSYPTDVSLWPDFSDMTMLPVPVQESHEYDKNNASVSIDLLPNPAIDPYLAAQHHNLDANQAYLSQLPATPDCPCLPNLYLTLSTLSTLSAFPVSSGTIDTLLNAHRTGRSVIYCNICPQKFQTGSQNVMLSSMLITVLADHWHRVKKATARDLRAGFTDDQNNLNNNVVIDVDPNTNMHMNMTIRQDLEWRTFGYKLVRACVFNDAPIPSPPGSNRPLSVSSGSCSSPSLYALSDLCCALERRQKQWHGIETETGEFPERMTTDLARGHTLGMTLEEIKECEEHARTQGDDGLLCLRIVKHARMIMRSLDGGPPRLGDS